MSTDNLKRALLLAKRRRSDEDLNALIRAVEKHIADIEGDVPLTQAEKGHGALVSRGKP